MSVTLTDIQAFTDYAHARVSNGRVDSMPQLFSDWLVARNRDEVNAAIREGLADIDAGRTRSAREFMVEVREKLADGSQ